jgi:hypothetical protein
MGHDLLSRVLYGARISLSIGLIGVFMSLFLGILLGGISGYYGGKIDNLIQRLIEVVQFGSRDPPVDGHCRRRAQGMVHRQNLLCHDAYPFVHQLDGPCPGGARAFRRSRARIL